MIQYLSYCNTLERGRRRSRVEHASTPLLHVCRLYITPKLQDPEALIGGSWGQLWRFLKLDVELVVKLSQLKSNNSISAVVVKRTFVSCKFALLEKIHTSQNLCGTVLKTQVT